MTDATDKTTSKSFLEPKLGGDRFVEHSIPLEVLGDLVAVQDILIQVANDVYKEVNDAKRGPRNLRRGVSLQLRDVGEGSAIACLDLRIGSDVSHASEVRLAFEVAKERLVSALNAAKIGDRASALAALGPDILARFEKIGSSLNSGEFVEFAPHAQDLNKRARLDTSSRSFLAGIAKEGAPVEQRVEVRGVISAISTFEPGFEIRNFAGEIIPCRLLNNPEQVALAAQATKSAIDVDLLERVVLTGIALVAENGTIQSVEQVDSLDIVPPHDVQTRIEELRIATPESFNDNGILNPKRLDWFLKGVLSAFNNEESYPAIFIGPDQDLFLEWRSDRFTTSLEVDTNQQDAEIHFYDSESRRSTFKDVRIETGPEWNELAEIINNWQADGLFDE